MIHEQDPDVILFAGDWHGNFNQAKTALKHAHQHDIHHVIQLGDFGVFNNTVFLEHLEREAAWRDITIYFVDGNHEEFPYLYSFPLAEEGTRELTPHVFHLPRGFRFTWGTTRFLAMGGAYSVDRSYRELNRSYWDEELITDQDIAAAGTDQTDVLLAHDSPADAPNPVTDNPFKQQRGRDWFGAEHIANANLHRLQLQRVTDATDPVLIFHGHYHSHQTSPAVRPATGTYFDTVSLSEGGNALHYWTHILTKEELETIVKTNREAHLTHAQ